MNIGIVDITWTWSPRPTSRMCSTMPLYSLSKPRPLVESRYIAPSAVAASMIVNSGEPLMNASASSATGRLT